jgi:DNA-nicking Smr family endonuclease
MGKDKDEDEPLDDAALWAAMTQDVRRLPGRMPKRQQPEPSAPKNLAKPLKNKQKPTPPRPKNVPAGREVDGRTAQRLRRGQMEIDGRLDLHGLTRDQARAALERFILSSFAAGRRCLLVITGKGKSRAGAENWLTPEPGVLKQNVPEWLETAPLRDIVLRTEPARPQHGGGGALYVLLRRNRDAG